MNSEVESGENMNLRGRRKRMGELAAQLKEKNSGNLNSLEKILVKFSIEEGLRLNKAQEYLDAFQSIGLIKIEMGKRRWKYNSEAEWELFKINI